MNGFDAGRPQQNEYDPYYLTMIGLVPDQPVLEVLEEQRHEIMGFLGSLDKATADFRYGPEKWSVKEVLGHVVDTERIFGARALCFARGETIPLPPFEQDEYVRSAGFDKRSLSSLSREFEAVRRSTESLFHGREKSISRSRQVTLELSPTFETTRLTSSSTICGAARIRSSCWTWASFARSVRCARARASASCRAYRRVSSTARASSSSRIPFAA